MIGSTTVPENRRFWNILEDPSEDIRESRPRCKRIETPFGSVRFWASHGSISGERMGLSDTASKGVHLHVGRGSRRAYELVARKNRSHEKSTIVARKNLHLSSSLSFLLSLSVSLPLCVCLCLYLWPCLSSPPPPSSLLLTLSFFLYRVSTTLDHKP